MRYGQTVPNLDLCTVPRVIGLTLVRATAALRRARCDIGKAIRPKRPVKRVLVVKSQRPAANTIVVSGTRVGVTLG